MRTVRRVAHELNAGKQQTLDTLLSAYAIEKQRWLTLFARRDKRPFIKRHRQIRNEAVHAGYESESGLQARLWKLALVDAAETWDKYWQALFVELRAEIGARRCWSDDQRHYGFWLLSGYPRFFALLDGSVPDAPFLQASELKKPVALWLRKAVRRHQGKTPSVKNQRGIALDANCYSVFEKNGAQYLKIMTLQRGRRLVIPLKGFTTISGNIRVVLHGAGVEVHVSQALKPAENPSDTVEAIDFGYTEAFTDTGGNSYGDNLGAIITQASDRRSRVGKSRNKLRALAEKYKTSSNPKHRQKARHIQYCNLGKQKWDHREAKARAAIQCEINRGLNDLFREKQPAILVTEHLRHAFSFDKPRSWNRRLSAWTRGVLQDRVEFKALAKGFRHEPVNPAFGSQTCYWCDYVEKANRSGDKFLCLHCGHADHADRVAAMNYLKRYGDPEITRYTPYRDLKNVLLERFHRRLEAEGGKKPPDATVPGRTPDTVPVEPRRPTRLAPQQGDVGQSNLTVKRSAKQNETVACEYK